MESHMLPLLHIRTLLPATSATCCLLPTCLLAIYPQLSCYLSHVFHVIRFILQEVHTEGVRPPKPICQDPIADHYMMAQGRVLSCLELWMLSTTNMRFLQSLQICTLFWLQDAVVLIDRIPELIDIAPWNLLTDGGSVTADFERLGTDVHKAIDSSDIIQQGKLMDQTDLLRSVQSGCVQTANALDSRLSTVPSDVMIGMLEVWNREHEERRAQMVEDVMYANQQSWRRMMVAGSGEAVPPQSHGRRPFNAETPSRRSQAPSNGDTVSSPLRSPYTDREEKDGEALSGEEDSRAPSEEVAGGSNSLPSGIAGGG